MIELITSRIGVAISCAIVCLGIGSAAEARQTAVDKAAIEAQQQRALRISHAVQATPGGASSYALPVPEVSLTTTKEGAEATAVIGVSNPFWGFRTTFRTPIGKEDTAEATPISLSGLANQATIDFTFIRKRFFRNLGGKTIDDLMLEFCTSRGVSESECDDQKFTREEDRQAFLNIGIHERPSFFTANVQIGGKSFDFVEKGATIEQTEKFTSIAGGGSYGWLFMESRSVVAINVNVARDYAPSKDSTSLCQPLDTDVDGTLRCDDRVIGRPTASEKLTATLDFRKVFTRPEVVPATPGEGDKPPTPSPFPERSVPLVGMSVQLRVQAVKDGETVWGVEAPVYFLQKQPAPASGVSLNGGASSGWNSKDGFVARVFIGTAFSLFGSTDINK